MPVTRWHIPNLMSTTPVDYFLIMNILFGVRHHRAKNQVPLGYIASTTEDTKIMNKTNNIKIWLKVFLTFIVPRIIVKTCRFFQSS